MNYPKLSEAKEIMREAADGNSQSFQEFENLIGHGLIEAFDNDNDDAKKFIHGTLYSLYVSQIESPWEREVNLPMSNMRLFNLGYRIEKKWRDSENLGVEEDLPKVRTSEDFQSWCKAFVQSHPSNVTHPLFSFLEKEASFSQLTEFIRQETAFDIYFSDLIIMMIPGIYGTLKMEVAQNFWDELGRGVEENTHRNLRLQLMNHLGIDEFDHLKNTDSYSWEELALANIYFDTIVNRNKLVEAIGVMLATETMVPGRLEKQIEGWKRVGLPSEVMTYLNEHTVVDVKHAEDWMEEVVTPLLNNHPDLVGYLIFGVKRRMKYAGLVCDRMLNELKTIS